MGRLQLQKQMQEMNEPGENILLSDLISSGKFDRVGFVSLVGAE